MANYAVLHSQKNSGSSGGLGNHIDRKEGKEHSFLNADKNRRHLNKEFAEEKFKGLKLSEAIDKRIEEGYNGNRKIRTDAVKSVNHIFSGSNERMLQIFSDEKKKMEWLRENYKFACREFGKDNIVRFTLHMDEKTPHIHCVAVPLTKDGRLSAKEIIGNRKQMELRQDRYAEAMNKFGLERGISAKLTKARHETAKEWNRKVANNIENKPFEEVKSFLGINKSKTIEKAKNELKTLQFKIAEQKTQLERERENNNHLDRQYSKILSRYSQSQEEAEYYKVEFCKSDSLLRRHQMKMMEMLKYNNVVESMRAERGIVPTTKTKTPEKEIIEEVRKKGRGFSR